MNVIDLTYLIETGMPVFPGTEPPSIRDANTIEKDGFAEKILKMYSHTGTHMDAQAHIIENGKTLDNYDVDNFFGKGFILDMPEPLDGFYRREDLEHYEEEIRKAEYVIVKTGWSQYWGKAEYYEGFPCLSREAAEYLTRFSLKGIGFDSISADPVEDGLLSNHRILLGSGMVIVENLKNLDEVGCDRFFWFSCMPLRTKDADGSPVRAVAITDFD